MQFPDFVPASSPQIGNYWQLGNDREDSVRGSNVRERLNSLRRETVWQTTKTEVEVNGITGWRL